MSAPAPKSKSRPVPGSPSMFQGQFGPELCLFAWHAMFQTSNAIAWNFHASLPVLRSSAMTASDVSVPGCEVFSPVVTMTRLRFSSIVGTDQIGAPDGPRCFTPFELTWPVYVAVGMVWYSHALEPSLAFSATTAPWPTQHSKLALPPAATPDAEIGTITLSLWKMTPPRIEPGLSVAAPLAFHTEAPVFASSTWMSRPIEKAMTG